MKFFTKDWAAGELADEAYAATFPRYAEYLSSLSLPPDAQVLADADLHDGILENLAVDGLQLSLSFVVGDLQRGYCSTTIIYAAFLVLSEALAALQRFSVDETVELLNHEVDRDADAFIHRMLFSTHEDVAIRFRSVAVVQVPRSTRSSAR